MLLAQMSDIHFLPKGTLAFGRVDTAGCLEQAIRHLNAFIPPADAVLITGDLTNDGDASVWAELMGLLGTVAGADLSGPRQSRRSRADAQGRLPVSGCFRQTGRSGSRSTSGRSG